MPYYPKSKIQTNLFSNGELVRSSDFSPYIGPYYKLSTGDKYEGKDAQALRYPELLVDPKDFLQTTPDVIITEINTDINDAPELGNYTLNLKEQYIPQRIPVPYYPQPTSQDYQVGYFTRYFAKQVNDYKFIEINQTTFENLAEHNGEYLWQLYNVVDIPWQISGNIEKIYRTNRNIVKIEEKNGFKGLSTFLKENYIKFYQGTDKNKDLSSLSRDNHNDLDSLLRDNHNDLSSYRLGDMK